MEVEEPEFEIKKKTKTTTSQVQFTVETHFGLAEQQIKTYQDVEKKMQEKEMLVIRTQEAKYSLESFIYACREDVQKSENLKFTEQAERDLVIKQLADHEQWLYDDGFNATMEQFQSKLSSVKSYSKNFYNRLNKVNNISTFL